VQTKHPYIITISSEKGGVGKTTLATNLAIYLKAMREDLPVTIFSFDNHFTIDSMFAIGQPKSSGSVRELLMGRPAVDLIQLGQYGVSYIPSSADLGDLHYRFSAPMTLSHMLAASEVSGIVIIDTRPDLNVLTVNALYAADRVLIPVKDMPSLQNCKNIFALFDRHGIDKSSLALLPCLIDERIKFPGAHADQKSLLRAFAAERGYRCLDNYISKSPKVESLGTNPDGKIYPILTHARGTEVFKQYAEITREILREFEAAQGRSRRHLEAAPEKDGKEQEYEPVPVEDLAGQCLICAGPLAERAEECSFYYEISGRARRGFLHSDCFVDMLCGALYGLYDHSQALGAARKVILEKAGKSVSLFMPRHSAGSRILDFRQFDQDGVLTFRKEVPLTGSAQGEGDAFQDRLHLLLDQSLPGFAAGSREGGWLAVHPVDSSDPGKVLLTDNYRAVRQLEAKILSTLGIFPDAGAGRPS
jgi:chromosome partitioning protein